MRRPWIAKLIALALTVSACAGAPQATSNPTQLQPSASPPTTATRAVTLTAAPSPTPRAATAIAPTATPTPSLDPIRPTLLEKCPPEPYVPLEELGLPDQYKLLLVPETVEGWDAQKEGFYSVSAGSSSPEAEVSLTMDGYINWGHAGVSPDARWLIMERKAESDGHVKHWIVSHDSRQQWPLAISEEDQYGYWLDDITMVLTPSEWWKWSRPTFIVVNPFSGASEKLLALPEVQIEGIGAKFFVQSERLYLIYQQRDDYHLLEVYTGRKWQVLEWLREDPAEFLDKGVTIADDGRVIVTISRPYGLDISYPMTADELLASNSYTATMRQVILPDSVLPAHPTTLRATPTLGMVVFGEGDAGPHYWLNISEATIAGYCFAEGGGGPLSPDGSIYALTQRWLPSPQPIPKSVFLINLKTGYIARLDGYEAVNWVVRAD